MAGGREKLVESDRLEVEKVKRKKNMFDDGLFIFFSTPQHKTTTTIFFFKISPSTEKILKEFKIHNKD